MRSSLRRGTAPSYRTSPISAATPNSVATTPALLTKRQSPSADSAKRTSSSSTAAAPSIRSSSIALPTRSVQSTTSPRVSEPPAPPAPSVALRASPSTCRISSASEEGPSRSSLEVVAAARCAAAATSTGARNAHAMVLHSSAWSPPPAHSSSTVGTLDAAAFLKRLPMTPLGLGAAGGGGGGGGGATASGGAAAGGAPRGGGARASTSTMVSAAGALALPSPSSSACVRLRSRERLMPQTPIAARPTTEAPTTVAAPLPTHTTIRGGPLRRAAGVVSASAACSRSSAPRSLMSRSLREPLVAYPRCASSSLSSAGDRSRISTHSSATAVAGAAHTSRCSEMERPGAPSRPGSSSASESSADWPATLSTRRAPAASPSSDATIRADATRGAGCGVRTAGRRSGPACCRLAWLGGESDTAPSRRQESRRNLIVSSRELALHRK
mmetsp:Transcript_29180/g.88480  ORF Transcript_29180/g.88480 Transcript_29180/m.88480 type:complete len:442 (-) Transcript_29180:13-1338(-)